MSNPDDLVAALDNHQVTDSDGELLGDANPAEEPTAQEETTVEESTPAEKPREESTEPTQGEEENPDQPVEDETGKRYVPETRFKEVYGKAKQSERELAAYKAQLEAYRAQVLGKAPKPDAETPKTTPEARKAEQLETELLFSTLPQFNPESTDYSEELDQLGADIYRANPGITKLEAARRAMKTAKNLAEKVAQVKQEARVVKSLQADQGITNRVISREATKVDPSKMTDLELEAYLKQSGQWPE